MQCKISYYRQTQTGTDKYNLDLHIYMHMQANTKSYRDCLQKSLHIVSINTLTLKVPVPVLLPVCLMQKI